MKAAGLLCAGGLLLFFFVFFSYREDQQEHDPGSVLFTESALFSADRIIIKKKQSQTEMLRINGEWMISEPSFPAEPSLVQGLLKNLSQLKISNTVSTNPEKEVIFGFGDRVKNLDIFCGDKEIASLEIGKSGADFQTGYMRYPGSPTVYLGSRNLALLCRAEPSWWIRKKLIPGNWDSFVSLSLTAGKSRILLKKNEQKWSLTVPLKRALTDQERDLCKKTVNGLLCTGLVNNLSSSSFNVKPVVTVEVENTDQEKFFLSFYEHKGVLYSVPEGSLVVLNIDQDQPGKLVRLLETLQNPGIIANTPGR